MTELVSKGHYREPNIKLKCDFTDSVKADQRVEYPWDLEYDPYRYEWKSLCRVSNVGKSDHEDDSRYGDSHKEYCLSGLKKRGFSKQKARQIWKEHLESTSKRS